VGFLLLSMGLAILLSLVRTTPKTLPGTRLPVRALSTWRLPGAWLSDVLIQNLRAPAFLFPLLAFLLSWKWIRSDELDAGAVKDAWLGAAHPWCVRRDSLSCLCTSTAHGSHRRGRWAWPGE